MKITIVGAGAMGCLFVALLRRSGLDVHVLEINRETVAAVSRDGILLENSAGVHEVGDIPITRDAASIGSADYVLFFVKSFDTAQAAAFAAGCIGGQTTVVTLQNGIGNVEVLAKRYPGNVVLAGTTAHGATLLGPAHVRHAGSGDTAIGCMQPRGRPAAVRLCDAFAAAGIDVRLVDDIDALLWRKLLVNIGINPLAALLDIANGRILELDHARAAMHAAVREAAAVAAAKGIAIDADEAVGRVEQVCRATRDNLCSMLQDLRAGRTTEIDYLNGAVVREGRSLRCAVSVNAMLSDLVRARQLLAGASDAGSCRARSCGPVTGSA